MQNGGDGAKPSISLAGCGQLVKMLIITLELHGIF